MAENVQEHHHRNDTDKAEVAAGVAGWRNQSLVIASAAVPGSGEPLPNILELAPQPHPPRFVPTPKKEAPKSLLLA